MLLTVLLDDIVSAVVSFRMMVVDVGSGNRRLRNVTVTVLRQDLAIGKSCNGFLCCC